jgi:hypothetical protein
MPIQRRLKSESRWMALGIPRWARRWLSPRPSRDPGRASEAKHEGESRVR